MVEKAFSSTEQEMGIIKMKCNRYHFSFRKKYFEPVVVIHVKLNINIKKKTCQIKVSITHTLIPQFDLTSFFCLRLLTLNNP